MTDRLHLGFGCLWDADRRATWSGSSWHLYEALRRHATLGDLGVQVGPVAAAVLKALYPRRFDGRWTTVWRYGAGFRDWTSWIMSRRAARLGCDAALLMGAVAPLRGVPYLVMEDMSLDAVLAHAESTGTVPIYPYPLAMIRRMRDQQRRQFEGAAAVLAMGRWLARSLCDETGLPPSKVHVVNPGISAVAELGAKRPELPDRTARKRTKLLFVGTRFYPKGGGLVLAALEILRSSHDAEITLTICGPTAPDRELPAGVSLVGRLPPAEVAALYDTHDLLVMPSQIEPFGIVFIEALARGMPCIGRNAFAMPEIITDGVNGALIEGEDPEVLAEVVVRVLRDDALYERCRAQVPDVLRHYSWDRAARQVVEIAGAALS